jgi:hypothetical protein
MIERKYKYKHFIKISQLKFMYVKKKKKSVYVNFVVYIMFLYIRKFIYFPYLVYVMTV